MEKRRGGKERGKESRSEGGGEGERGRDVLPELDGQR